MSYPFFTQCTVQAGQIIGSQNEIRFCVYQDKKTKKWGWFSEDKRSSNGFNTRDEAIQNASEVLSGYQ